MRVKLEAVAPLPPLKAWFCPGVLSTIHDLKISLCADLQPFRHARLRAQDLVLLLDDFQLLDSSPIDLVRDGDLIVIKRASPPPQHKRKASPLEVGSPSRKRTKTEETAASKPLRTANAKRQAPQAQSSSSSSSDSESSSSSSSSDSDSDTSSSDSDSDSDSDTSSVSSSSSSSSASSSADARAKSADAVLKKFAIASKAHTVSTELSHPSPPVPPGLGKPSTHSRNIRRRRKKMYERIALTVEPTSVNDIPLGARASTHEPAHASGTPFVEPEVEIPLQGPSKRKGKERADEEDEEDSRSGQPAEAPLFMMASLQNKNKRRGFKDALHKGVPPKIVFSTEVVPDDPDAMVAETALETHSRALEVSRPPSRAKGPRLIPPSEKQELGLTPPNLFVTSVDVEEGMWSGRGKGKNKKKKKRVEETWEAEEDSFAGGLPYDDEAAAVIQMEASVASTNATASGKASVERAAVEAQWSSLRRVTDKSQVAIGFTVAWKALGINMATLTPEMLLHVGRIQQCRDQMVVQPVSEASAAVISFGGPVEDEDEMAEEVFEWSDVLGGDWRLVAAH